VAFLIHFGSLRATLLLFKHWGVKSQMTSSLGDFFILFLIFLVANYYATNIQLDDVAVKIIINNTYKNKKG
jgi:hypothetical protein